MKKKKEKKRGPSNKFYINQSLNIHVSDFVIVHSRTTGND